MSTYEDAVKLISGAERNSETSFAISPDGLEARFSMKSEDYMDALRLIELPEGRLASIQKQVQREEANAAQATEQSISMEKELSEAAEAVSSTVSRAGNVKIAASAPKAGGKEEKAAKAPGSMVLPRLSLTDQISDLEKIKEGLLEDAFDDMLTGIVREEVDNMLKVSSKEKAGGHSRARRHKEQDAQGNKRDGRIMSLFEKKSDERRRRTPRSQR